MNDRSRFLITTADERTWRTDQPVLWLGEWCRRYDRRAAWEHLDGTVFPYQFGDKRQLDRDEVFLRALHEQLLTELAAALNSFHGVRHSDRYWRILLCPWLGLFTRHVHAIWVLVERATRSCDISGSAYLALTDGQRIATDVESFGAKWPTDEWNSWLVGRILTGWTDVPCERVTPTATANASANAPAVGASLRRRVRRRGMRTVSLLSGALSRSNDALLISTYLPREQEVRLQLALGQFPAIRRSPPTPRVSPAQPRERVHLAESSRRDFDGCIRSLIEEQLPTVYLEGYDPLVRAVDTMRWPERPRFIFTSSSQDADMLFKAWTARKVETGTPYAIGQHGGGFGTARLDMNERIALKTADRFLTWGWTDEDPKCFPTVAIKLVGSKTGKWNPGGGLLQVLTSEHRYELYPRYINGAPLTVYLEEQFRFASALPEELRSELLVRLHPGDYGWAIADRWRDRHPHVHLNRGVGTIDALIRGSRLFVYTYNGAGFLETLARNTPTIVFWNPELQEIRASAEPYFDRLRQVGLFHDTPESAAEKAAEVWTDVAEWWARADVQAARRDFCARFARLPTNPLGVLKDALLDTRGASRLA